MANPLLKHVKIGTFWQDIVYENLPMLCYKCGRLGHREPHYLEGMAEPTTAPPQESNPYVQAAPPLEPTHMSIPWKTVQTRRTHARRRPSEPTPHGKSTLPDLYSPVHPHGQATLSHAHVQRTHQINSVIGQEFDGVKRPAGFYCGKVASHGNNTNYSHLRREWSACMNHARLAVLAYYSSRVMWLWMVYVILAWPAVLVSTNTLLTSMACSKGRIKG